MPSPWSRLSVGAGLTCICGALLAEQAAAQSLMLKPTFKTGDAWYVEIEETVNQNVTGAQVPGGELNFRLSQTFGVIEKVESAADGKVQLLMTHDRAAMTMDLPPPVGKLEFDSDAGEGGGHPLLNGLLKPIPGLSMIMELDADSNVTNFSSMEAAARKIRESAGGNPFLPQILERFSDARAEQIWGTTRLILYAGKEVKAGDVWKKTIKDTIPQVGLVIMEYECTLSKIEDRGGRRVALVTYNMRAASDPSAHPPGETQGSRPTIKDGRFCGTASFDIRDGRFVETTQSGQMTIITQLPPTAEGQEPSGVTVKTSATEKMRAVSPAQREAEKKQRQQEAESLKSRGAPGQPTPTQPADTARPATTQPSGK